MADDKMDPNLIPAPALADDGGTPALFSEVTFYIVESPELVHEAAREIARMLIENGALESKPLGTGSAMQLDLQEITHIISSTIDFPDYSEVEGLMIPVVKPEWVNFSIQKNRIAHVRPYTPDPRFFLCGIIATIAELPVGDKEAICGGIIAMGGQYGSNLTKFTTHIVALNMDNEKCRQAVAKRMSIKIVLPHWFDDCLKLGRRIDEAPYLLPNPEIERVANFEPMPLPKGPDLTYSHAHDGGAMALDPPSPKRSSSVFERKKIRLGEDLELSPRLKSVIATVIVQMKGEVVDKVEDADIYVGQFRDGEEYLEASHAGIHVGSLTWLYWICAHGRWTSPLAKLLHYPLVRGGLPGMEKFKITVSNYGGDARLYLENLIEACGAKFTKSMKTENTHLITARSHSEKCQAAREWNIDMVNHLWLEESYAKWEIQSVTNPRYTHFPARTNLMEVVGQTPMDVKALEQFYMNDDDDLMSVDEGSGPAANGKRPKSTPRVKAINKRTSLNNTSTPSRWSNDELSGPSPSISGSGRKAKEQAAARLHDQIMPDLMQYEKEQKRKGGILGGGRVRRSKSPADERTRKRTVSMGVDSTDEDSRTDNKKQKKRPRPTVYLLMTAYRDWVNQPHREDTDRKALADLGIQCVNDPTTCTHLAAPHIVRTEKFCCALAKAPIIVSTEWPKACLKEEKIVDTEPYLLHDSDGERRLSMSLSQSLERARKNKGQLLQGQIIYVTPGVHGGFETYRKIVEANGGVCLLFRGPAKRATNLPDSDTLVLLSGDDAADRRFWNPFLKMARTKEKEAVVYKADWLLDLAMTQKIEWTERYKFPE
ncbi:BRCT domain-containing protein [Tuber indicum]|nr:BRCT domain-containing protein [Tuber indicum]